jgi:hypothetical protein
MHAKIRRISPAATLLIALAVSSLAIAGEPWLVGGMKDAGPYPRSVFRTADLPVILERLNREPYLGFLSRLQNQAQQSLDPAKHDVGYETIKASNAKAAAFLYATGRYYDAAAKKAVPFAYEAARRVYGEKTARYLLAMYTQSRAKGIQPDADIHTAEELHAWAQAYDLLKGGGYDFMVDGLDAEAEIVQNIADLTADFYTDYQISNYYTLRAYLNNHRSKSAAAIGLSAIVLNGADFADKAGGGAYDTSAWLDFAVRYLDLVLMSIETDQERSYQESGGYYSYTAVDHVAFFRAWHTYTGAASYTYSPWNPDEKPFYLLSATVPYTVTDFWTSPVFAGQLDYFWRTMLPDRTSPPYDDCTPGTSFFWGYFVNGGFSNAPIYRWAWETSPYGLELPRIAGEADVIVNFDDSIPPAPPPGPPDTVLPVAGNVVLRSSWGTDATALVINAENGNATARTYNRWGDFMDGLAGHEHLEPSSFMLYAGREPLIIDSGYLGWDNHTKVNGPGNHNILLVDGKGPEAPHTTIPIPYIDDAGTMRFEDPQTEGGWVIGPDGDAFLAGQSSMGGLDAAVVKTRYAASGLAWSRSFIFVDRKFLVVHDEFSATDGAGHSVRFQLHGNGGGTSGGTFEQLEHGGLWTQSDSRARTVLLSDHALTRSIGTAIHDKWQWAERTHTVLYGDMTLPPGGRGHFMSVIAVEKKSGASFEETNFAVDSGTVGWSAGDVAYSAALTTGSPGGIAVTRTDSAKGSVAAFNGVSEGFEILTSTSAGTAYGYVFSEPPGGAFVLDGAFGGGKGICALETEAGVTKVTRPGNGPFELAAGGGVEGVVAVADVISNPARDAYRPVLPVLRPVTLSGKRSCTPAGITPGYKWKVLMKPEMSAAAPKSPDATETEFTPDIPGAYRISLEVGAGGIANTAETLLVVYGDLREARAELADGGKDATIDAGSLNDASPASDGGMDGAHGAETEEPGNGGSCGGGCSMTGLLLFVVPFQLRNLTKRKR